MRKPTRSIALIRRTIERARRERCMVALHPDTVEWLALLAAARKNCVLEPHEAKTVVRLLGVLQDHLESAIEGTLAEGELQPRESWLRPHVARDRRDWKAAEALVKQLTGAKP
jgi:hypothetical protein